MNTSSISVGTFVVDPAHADLAQSLLFVQDALADLEAHQANGKGKAPTSQIGPDEDLTDEEYAIKMQENHLQDILRTMEDYRLAKSLALAEGDTPAGAYTIVNQEAINYLRALIPNAGSGVQNGSSGSSQSSNPIIASTYQDNDSVTISNLLPDTYDEPHASDSPTLSNRSIDIQDFQDNDDGQQDELDISLETSSAATYRKALLDIFYTTGQAAPSNVASKHQIIDLSQIVDDDEGISWLDDPMVQQQDDTTSQISDDVQVVDWMDGSMAQVGNVGTPPKDGGVINVDADDDEKLGDDSAQTFDSRPPQTNHDQSARANNDRASSPAPDLINILGDQFGYPTVYCMICGDLVVGEPTLRAQCGHDICVDCVQDLVASASRDESLYPPQCCRRPFSQESMSPFLTVKLKSDFDAKRLEFDIPAAQRVFCPRETCSTFIGSSEGAGQNVTCPTCSAIVCVSCRQPAHPGDTCTENSLTASVKKLAQENRWQTCPQCRAIVEKTIGCDHITCRCASNFCYKCGNIMTGCRC